MLLSVSCGRCLAVLSTRSVTGLVFAKIVLSCPPLPFVANKLVSEQVSSVELVHPAGGLILIRN